MPIDPQTGIYSNDVPHINQGGPLGAPLAMLSNNRALELSQQNQNSVLLQQHLQDLQGQQGQLQLDRGQHEFAKEQDYEQAMKDLMGSDDYKNSDPDTQISQALMTAVQHGSPDKSIQALNSAQWHSQSVAARNNSTDTRAQTQMQSTLAKWAESQQAIGKTGPEIVLGAKAMFGDQFTPQAEGFLSQLTQSPEFKSKDQMRQSREAALASHADVERRRQQDTHQLIQARIASGDVDGAGKLDKMDKELVTISSAIMNGQAKIASMKGNIMAGDTSQQQAQVKAQVDSLLDLYSDKKKALDAERGSGATSQTHPSDDNPVTFPAKKKSAAASPVSTVTPTKPDFIADANGNLTPAN